MSIRISADFPVEVPRIRIQQDEEQEQEEEQDEEPDHMIDWIQVLIVLLIIGGGTSSDDAGIFDLDPGSEKKEQTVEETIHLRGSASDLYDV